MLKIILFILLSTSCGLECSPITIRQLPSAQVSKLNESLLNLVVLTDNIIRTIPLTAATFGGLFDVGNSTLKVNFFQHLTQRFNLQLKKSNSTSPLQAVLSSVSPLKALRKSLSKDSPLSLELSEVSRKLLEINKKANGTQLYKLLEDSFSSIGKELDSMWYDIERTVKDLGHHGRITQQRVVLPGKFHSLEDAVKTQYVVCRAVCLHAENLRQVLNGDNDFRGSK